MAMAGIAALLLMGVVGLSYREWSQYSRANLEARQRREILDSVGRLLFTLLDAETGQRGYLLTADNRYLEPYNQAVQAVPGDLAGLRKLLARHPGESGALARLNALVDEKMAALRHTVEMRRARGAAAAIAVVLSDRGKQTMDDIRAVCADIQRREDASQAEASLEGEAAARTAVLITVAGSLLLLLLVAFGLEPFASPDPQAQQRSAPLRYGVAVLAVLVIVLFRMALTPLMGARSMPFTLFFPAVWFAAWYGGLRPGMLSVVLSVVAGAYFFAAPGRTLLIQYHDDQVAVFMLVIVGFGMALLSRSQQRAVVRALQAENAERNERQRFETTLASIGDAVVATDAQGRVTFANRIALSLMRCTESDIAGKPLDGVFRIVNEFTREVVQSPAARALREGAIVGLASDTVLIARDGAEVPIDDSAAPIRSGGGAARGTVMVFRDVTERRRAEAAGRLLAAIVESSDDAIFSEDLNGVITSWNRGAERMFGYSAGEIIGRPISMLAPPGHVEEVSEILERLRRGEHIENYHTIRRTKAGRQIHASLVISPLIDAAGRIAGASKIVRDITAQIEAQKEVAEQRERLRVTLASIGDAVLATDAVGRVSYLNPVAERLTGWTSAEASGQPLEDVFRIVNEESRLPVENPAAKVLRVGHVVGLANHTLLIARGGKEIAIDDSAAPIRDASGGVTGVVLVFRDISEKREAARQAEERRLELLVKERALASEKAMRDMEAELARVLRAMSVNELASSIAHEVNQPLAGVLTNAEAGLRWLNGATPDIQEVRRSLTLIARDANRAGAVVQRIREFLKKEPPRTTPLDLDAITREAVTLLASDLARRRIELRTDLAADLPLVRGDRIQIQQVIVNLLLNGAEAMTSAAEPKRLVISTRRSGGEVLVTVKDSGAGIASPDLARIFQPFFTTKPGGIGMGLSISRSIMEAHGGRIWAEANDGPGITVSFSLPAAAGDAETPRTGSPS